MEILIRIGKFLKVHLDIQIGNVNLGDVVDIIQMAIWVYALINLIYLNL